MLDRDLAVLYGIPTRALKQAVRRNLERFPDDFMFVLDASEFQIWTSQFVTPKEDRKRASIGEQLADMQSGDESPHSQNG